MKKDLSGIINKGILGKLHYIGKNEYTCKAAYSLRMFDKIGKFKYVLVVYDLKDSDHIYIVESYVLDHDFNLSDLKKCLSAFEFDKAISEDCKKSIKQADCYEYENIDNDLVITLDDGMKININIYGNENNLDELRELVISSVDGEMYEHKGELLTLIPYDKAKTIIKNFINDNNLKCKVNDICREWCNEGKAKSNHGGNYFYFYKRKEKDTDDDDHNGKKDKDDDKPYMAFTDIDSNMEVNGSEEM